MTELDTTESMATLSESYVVRYTMAVDDFVDAMNYIQRPALRLAAAAGVTALAAGFVVFGTGGSPTLALALVVYGSFDLLFVRFQPLRRFLARRANARLIGTTIEFSIDPVAGLQWVETHGRGEVGWPALTAVVEDGRVLAFVAGRVPRAVIPKRAFRSSAHAAAFRDEARRLIALHRA